MTAVKPDLDRLAIDTIRTLSIDGVQLANSGHPGAPMGAAPMAYTLWTRFLRHAPTDPSWPDRDRFVLSAGHASMLLYSLLHLTGYDLSLDDLKSFRQWGSRTPGHPEYGLTPGVEATTGPLGQAGLRAVELARAAGALVSVDLASIGPLLAGGRRAAHALLARVAPDLVLATASEAEALVGRRSADALLDLAPMAVIKRGARGATVLAREGDKRLRFEVATEHLSARDTTGAGDAFDAGFLVGWFAARVTGRGVGASLQRAALAGHRAAARQLTVPRPELPLA